MKVTKRNLAKTVTLALVMASAVSVASAADLTIRGGSTGLSNAAGQGQEISDNLVADNIVISTENQAIIAYGYADNSPREMTIDAKSIDLTSQNATVLFLAGDHDNLGVEITYQKDMKVTGNGETHGIAVASKNGNLNIIGGEKLTVVAGENGVYARTQGASIDITADDVAITSNYEGTNVAKSNALYADSLNSQVKVTANKTFMATSKNEKALIAKNGGAISVDGTSDMIINGAVQADSTSTVDSSITLKGNNISITAKGNDGSQTEGAVRNADIVATGTVTIDAKGDLCGIGAGTNSDLRSFTTNSVKADKLVINSEGAFGVYANDHGWNTVGTVIHTELDAKDISITSKKDGICAMNGAVIDVKGFDTMVIQSEEQGINSEFGEITINGGATSIIADEEGIRSKLGGNISVAGDLLKINSGLEAIKLTGSSVAEVTTDLTQIDGDITLDDTSKVFVGFVGKESYLNGTITTADTAESTIALKNGATWYSDAQGPANDGIALMALRSGAVNTVTNIISDGGIIDLGDGSQVQTGSIAGSSLIVRTNSTDSQLTVNNTNTTTDVTVNGSSTVMGQIEGGASTTQVLNNLAGVVDGANVSSVGIAEGQVLGEITANVSADGRIDESSIQVRENATNAGMIDMTALSLVSWRGEFDDLNSRLGDLRSSREDNGLWTRFTRGESSYGSVTNRSSMYQIGYDRQAGDWTVGLAYSYTDGTSSFADGRGENTHNVVSLYGTKMSASGSYLDLVAKYGNLDYEYDVVGGAGSADYDTDAYAFSAEVGKRITASTGAWFEPQFQLTYGTVDSVSYKTANDIKVHQDSVDSFVARAGFMAGKPFSKGDIYVKASYLYDFEGEVKGTFANDNVSTDINRDLGGGWWEVGMGLCAHLSDVTHFYLDFEKAFAGEVDTDWKYNAGLRYSF